MTKLQRFEYLAVDKAGNKARGSLEAEDIKTVRQKLRERHLLPLQIKASKQVQWLQWRKTKLSTEQLCLLTRQMATLVKAGLPIADVLTAVTEQSTVLSTKKCLENVRNKVLEGHSLASAFADQDQSFSTLFCSVIAAGEKSGKLAGILERLASHTEEQARLKQKVFYALIYPCSLILVSFGIVFFLLDYVVPKMVKVYAHLHQDLPWLTRFLIFFSESLQTYGLYLLPLLLGLGIALMQALRSKPHWQQALDAFCLRLPLLGKSLASINTARYSKTLSMLSAAGLPLLESMKASSLLINNRVIRKKIEEAAEQVREGTAIHLALKQCGFFPAMSLHLIASGEASGTLEAMLEHSAKQQEEEILRLVDSLLRLFEPALILVMGGVVLFIVLAVLLPIFDLNQLNM